MISAPRNPHLLWPWLQRHPKPVLWLPADRSIPTERLGVRVRYKVGRTLESLDAVAKRNISAPAGNQTPFVQPVRRVTILTGFSWLTGSDEAFGISKLLCYDFPFVGPAATSTLKASWRKYNVSGNSPPPSQYKEQKLSGVTAPLVLSLSLSSWFWRNAEQSRNI